MPLEYPFLTKPCKGTFSLFASKIDSPDELRKKLHFSLFERLVLNRVAKPYNDLLHEFTDLEHDASAFVAEGLMKGEQVTVDGYVFEGEVAIMGSTIKIYGRARTSMKGEMRASGSYRYAIINVAAQSYLDLFATHQDAIDKLPFEIR